LYDDPTFLFENKFGYPDTFTDEELRERVQKLLSKDPTAKWVTIFRDPRDVTISACYHLIHDCPDMEQFVQTHLPRDVQWVDLRFRFFKEIKRQDDSRVDIFFYDELQRFGVRGVQQLGLLLLGQPMATTAEAEEIQKRANFKSMERAGEAIPQGGAQSGKMRKGRLCGFKSELSGPAAANATAVMRSMQKSDLTGRWICCDNPAKPGCDAYQL